MITAGEVIKNKRESLGKNLNTVSVDTKIQQRFLEYIENNQFDKFDSDIFASGFLKIYSKYLGLDVEKILALYRRSNQPNLKISKKNKKKFRKERMRISPKTIGILTLVLFLISIIGYIGYQIYKFQKPPVLIVSQPVNEYVSNEKVIIIKGSTEASTLVEVNGTQITVEDSGLFETNLELEEGVNTISLKAWKESNSKLLTMVTLKVIYSPEEQILPEQEVKEFLLTLTVSQSPSWIKLDVDGESKISQVLQPNTQHEYVVLKGFTIVSGRVQNTKLEVNGEELKISSSSTTGIGQLTCEIINNELKCE